MSLTEAIHDALQVPEPHVSEERVQETVARRLEELTIRTTVRRTGYFNHSWAPDLVVSSGEQPERWVYLRFGVHDASFEDDLRYLSDRRPFFIDIASDSSRNGEDDRAPVAAAFGTETSFHLPTALDAADRAEVLVSEASAVDRLEGGLREDRDVRTATQQVVVGGRGWVDRPAADRIVTSWRRATSAISDARAYALRTALDDVERFLNEVSSLDLETALRAKWIAAGQSAESFPGREAWRLQDRADWEIARLVLALVDHGAAVDLERWEDIAEAISASSLGHELYQIGEYRQGGAVNDLVRAALPLWTAQYAYVPPLESDTLIDQFDWAFGDYSLAINLIRRRAYFTDLGKKWSRVPRAASLPEARARQKALKNPAVQGAGILTPEENISHELRPTSKASLGERLEPYLADSHDAAWRAARITWLEIRVPGANALAIVDFVRDVVRTDRPIPLRTYVLLIGEFVAGLDADELEQLKRFLDGEGPEI